MDYEILTVDRRWDEVRSKLEDTSAYQAVTAEQAQKMFR